MEKQQISRRDFVSESAVTAGGLAAGLTGAGAEKGDIRVGLYSITYLGLWYRGKALTPEQVIQRAKAYGYQGVELDGKRPHGNPLDMPKSRCQQIRKEADDNGIEVYAVSANNDFSSPIPEHRECQLVYMRELIRMTADLGAKVLRVFLAWPGVTKVPQGGGRYDISRRVWQETHKDFSEEETWAWCREGLIESARHAGDRGVTLALQNHAPVIRDYQDVLRMVREADSPHLKVCLDAPLLQRKEEAYVRQAALAVGSLQVLSHFGGEYERKPDGTVKGQDFYPAFIRAMLEIGYKGYIGYELCHPLPVVEGQTVGIEFADQNARLAAEYMRGVIAEVQKEKGRVRKALSD